MKFILLTLVILLISIVDSWGQVDFNLIGKWSLNKVKVKDSTFVPKGLFFTFNEDMSCQFGKNKRQISQGQYLNKENNVILNSNKGPKGIFAINVQNVNNINLVSDTLILYLVRYYAPSNYVQNADESKIEELKGWGFFKNKNFDLALKHFNISYFKDATNYNAIVGLVYSQAAVEGEIDREHIEIVVRNTEATSWEIGITAAAFVAQYSPISDINYKSEDLNPEDIAAYYTGTSFLARYENGSIKKTGKYKDKKPIGKWIDYRNDETILKTTEYSEFDSIRTYTFHKEDGEMVMKEVVKVNGNMISPIQRYIYYQELPDKKGTYLFVSKTGFCVLDKNKKIEFDFTTPDNFNLNPINNYV